MAFRLDYNNSTLSAGLGGFGEKIGALLLMYASTKAVELEAKMKQNRPWTDRTGMAKATLNTRVSQPSQGIVRITLAHGVEYGVDLEMKHNKNYAIVGPTVDQEGPRLVSDLNDILSRLQL